MNLQTYQYLEEVKDTLNQLNRDIKTTKKMGRELNNVGIVNITNELMEVSDGFKDLNNQILNLTNEISDLKEGRY